MSGSEEAGAAVQRALLACMGPGAADELAQAQARLAWQEAVAGAGLAIGELSSRLVRVANGTAQVEASEPILAQELTLRADPLLREVNRRMAGRPGATIVVRRLAISVGRGERGRSL
jgi:Dna[CI] antecedent, DciA